MTEQDFRAILAEVLASQYRPEPFTGGIHMPIGGNIGDPIGTSPTNIHIEVAGESAIDVANQLKAAYEILKDLE